MNLPTYHRSQDTGLQWLGAMPSHWQAKRLKWACRVIPSSVDKKSYDGEVLVRLCNYTDVYYHDLITDDLPFMVATASPEQIDKFGLRPGDTIITKDSETANDIAVSAFVPETLQDVVCGYHLAIVRPMSGVNGAFIKRLFDTSYARSCFELLATGFTRVGLAKYELDNIVFPFPPLDEQTQIANFLDSEISKLDVAVREQRRLIELLVEKRRAAIARAVTKGLDSMAPMKSSEIEWLGEVPKHWTITRIANLYRESSETGRAELPILSVSIHHGVSDQELDDDELDRKVTRSEDRSKYKRVAPGDLAYNMMRAWQGAFGAVTVEGMVSPAYVVARPTQTIETGFVEHLLRTPQAIEQMRRYSRGVTDFRLRLYWDEFKNIQLALPPPEEARAICDYISKVDSDFRVTKAVCERSISLIEERKTALISEAITGVFNVCHQVATREVA